MGLLTDNLKEILADFEQKYRYSEPYNQYVFSCGVSAVNAARDSRKKDLHLREGESLEDLCLIVYLEKKPPTYLEFPSEYRGVRVVRKFMGKLTPASL